MFIELFLKIFARFLSVFGSIWFTQPLKYKTFFSAFKTGLDEGLHRFEIFEIIFIKFEKINLLSKKFIILPESLLFIYSYFAQLRISQTSIPLGQKSLHLPHRRHISIYLLMFFESFKSPFVTPCSIINLPLLTTQSLGFNLYSGQACSHKAHLEHLLSSFS